MSTRKQSKRTQFLSVVTFVLFLIALAVVLKGFGWCIGGVCDVGADILLP